MLPHRFREADNLIHRLALDPKPDQQGAELRGRGFAAEHLAHRVVCLAFRQIPAVIDDSADCFADAHLVVPSASRKFLRRSLPMAVRMDSGWNCTPSIG